MVPVKVSCDKPGFSVNEGTAYFLSDAHLGIRIPGCEDRESVLISFLREIASRAGYFFIVGDLFDFWIEYKHAIRPDYFKVIHELCLLVEGGTRVHYSLGNHDFAVGPFLRRTVGIQVHPDEFEITLQGKKLRILHGDGLRRGDRANRLLRKILRNPVNQKLFKLLHPNIGVFLGELFSGMSRRYLTTGATAEQLAEYRQLARRYLEQGDDIVVFGHTHVPEVNHFDSGVYCNPGSWVTKYPFIRLEEGVITMWEYLPGKPPRPLAYV